MRIKLALIFLLAAAFVVLLYLRPWETDNTEAPRFFDRLPDADIIGKSNVLDLSRTLTSTTYHYRVPFREFLTREFILGQGKGFGIDVQKPAFFFANEKDWMISDFGAMFIVSDSTLVSRGLEKFDKLFGLKDTTLYNHKVFRQLNEKLYFAYGDDWLLVYHGNDFKRVYHDVLFAKRNEIPPNWREFLNKEGSSNSPFVAKVTSRNFANYGIESVLLTMDNDSTSITLNAVIRYQDSIAFQIKPAGHAYASQEFTRTLANVNIEMSKLRDNPDNPLVKIMKQVGAKYSFPVNDFLLAWEGDLAFRQGGFQVIREKYIESELDENFNITEVVKYKNVKVPGYSVFLSTNGSKTQLLQRLLNKGILTQDDRKYRFLFSPPMNLHLTDTSMVFHTGKYPPLPFESKTQEIVFTYNGTPYTISLDSTDVKSLYGRIRIPLDRLVRENISDTKR